jgi:hypothetical protein
MDRLLAFLRRLEDASIHYSLASYRDSVMVLVTASPNERWEVEFFADGTAEVERFASDGAVVEADDSLLETLFAD